MRDRASSLVRRCDRGRRPSAARGTIAAPGAIGNAVTPSPKATAPAFAGAAEPNDWSVLRAEPQRTDDDAAAPLPVVRPRRIPAITGRCCAIAAARHIAPLRMAARTRIALALRLNLGHALGVELLQPGWCNGWRRGGNRAHEKRRDSRWKKVFHHSLFLSSAPSGGARTSDDPAPMLDCRSDIPAPTRRDGGRSYVAVGR